MLRLDLLGTFAVWRDGNQILDFHSQVVRALLVYLTVEADRSHERLHLAELLWPDVPTDQGLTQLRQALHRLGQALGEPTPLIITRQSVQLDSASVTSDIRQLRVQLDATTSHRHRAANACPTCLLHFATAVRFWRGELLAGFYGSEGRPFEDWLSRTRALLQQQISGAFAALAEHAFQRDYRAQAVVQLQRWLELEPWREEAHRRLMLVLALDGQRSMALMQFERCRKALHQQLNAEPTIATLTLARQIRVGTVEDPRPINQLPRLATPIIGREAEQAVIAALLNESDYRLITLVGPGGVGKTRLAQAAAAEAIFPDGVVFVSLSQIAQPNRARALVASRLGLPDGSDAQLKTQLAGFVQPRELLLVIDELDQLRADPRWVLELLHAAPRLRVIATARSPLGLSEERVLQIGGLALPTPDSADAPATALFREAAAQAGAEPGSDPADLAAVAAICRALDGLPLAIVLAAAQTVQQRPAAIAAALSESLDLLTSLARDRPERHQSVRASFAWSWQLLSAAEQRALAATTIFRDAFSAPIAAAVTDARPETLATLVRHSLLVQVGPDRYRFHSLTHRLAAEQLTDRAALAARHTGYFLRLLAELGVAVNSGAVQLAATQFLSARREIEAIGQRAADWRELAALLEHASGLADLYLFCNRYSDGREIFGLMVERLTAAGATQPEASPALRHALGAALIGLARMQYSCGSYAAALAAAEQAVQFGTAAQQAEAAGAAGWSLWQQSQHQRAAEQFTQVLMATNDTPVLAAVADHAQHGLGMVRWSQGALPEARLAYSAALAGYRRSNNRWRESDVLMNIGLTALHIGEYRSAAEHAGAALAICQTIGHRRGEGHALGSLGYIQLHRWDYRAARSSFEQCLTIRHETNDVQGECVALAGLGVLHYRLGADQLAEQLLAQAQQLAHAIGHRWAECIALGFQSMIAVRAARLHEALLLLEAATTLANQSGDGNAQGYAQLFSGHLRRALGDPAAALVAYQRSAQTRQALGQLHLTAEPLAGLAALALDHGRTADALHAVEQIVQIASRTELAGIEDPHTVDLVCLQTLRAVGDERIGELRQLAHARLERVTTELAPGDRLRYLALPGARGLGELLAQTVP